MPCRVLQVRVPLTEVAEVLNKLSTAHPLTFADLMAAYGTTGAAKPATEAEVTLGSGKDTPGSGCE